MDINNRIIKHFKDSADTKLKVKDRLAQPIASSAQIFFDCVAAMAVRQQTPSISLQNC